MNARILSRVFATFALGGAFVPLFALCPLGASSAKREGPEAEERFFPLEQGSTWVYRGTVRWFDPEKQQPSSEDVSIITKVERVYQKPEFAMAVLSGFPADLDWSTGQVEPKPSLLIETQKHEIFLDALPPDFDYSKLEKDASTLDKFLSADNLMFRWPLEKGMKFGDAESVKRDDNHYCWVVAGRKTKNLGAIKGLPSREADVFLLRFDTNPDDTSIELAKGVGILQYEYHHHGTVADTELALVEFHKGPAASQRARTGQ